MSITLRSLIPAAVLALGLPMAAHATQVTLTFAGLANGLSVGSTYNNAAGGFASFTNGTVKGEAVEKVGGCSLADGDPACPVLEMQVANGFNSNISFDYSAGQSQSDPTYVLFASDGTVLGSGLLSMNSASGVGDSWTGVDVGFVGKASKIVFDGVDGLFRIDNITFDTLIPTTEVPEPGSAALLALALAGVASTVRRRKA